MTLAVGDRCVVPAVAVRWYDDEPQPGLIEVVVTDRHGATQHLIDKYVYFAGEHLIVPETTYPIDVGVVCTVIAVDDGSAIAQSADCVDDDGEERTFDVSVDAVLRFAKEGETGELPATAVRWLAVDPEPGLVLVELLDDFHRPRQLVGKGSDFGSGTDLTPDATYPRPTRVHCTVERVRYHSATVSIVGPTDIDGKPFICDVDRALLNPAES